MTCVTGSGLKSTGGGEHEHEYEHQAYQLPPLTSTHVSLRCIHGGLGTASTLQRATEAAATVPQSEMWADFWAIDFARALPRGPDTLFRAPATLALALALAIS